MEAHKEHYLAVLDYMAQYLEELESVMSQNQSIVNSTAVLAEYSSLLSLTSLSKHLPSIQLLSFSDKSKKNFCNRFKALIIQNKDLSNFTRMHFFASSLIGRAKNAIANLSITASNFEVAWKATLITRFEDKRRLIEFQCRHSLACLANPCRNYTRCVIQQTKQ